MSTAPSGNRLSRLTKFLYGMGDSGFSLTGTIIAAYFAIFLTDVVRLSPSLAAATIFLGRSWDYINDPLIGYISDRTRTRWGRRRPFLLFGWLPFALTFILLWWIPPWTSSLARAIYYGVAYLLFDAAATFVYMPYFALTPELTEDYDERTSLNAYRMAFSILAGLVAFTVPLMIVGGFQPQNAPRILLMAVIFGFSAALPLLGVFWGTRERMEYQALPQPNLPQSLRAALHNRPFVFAMGIFLLTWVTIDLLSAMLLYFIKYWLLLESQSDLILATMFGVAFLVLPLWVYLSRRWDKRVAFIAGIAFLAVVQIVLVMLQPGVPFSVVLVLATLAGIGVSAAHVIPWSIMPDAVEWDELQTGERHEGTFYSLLTLMQKVASSVALPLALMALDRSGYVPNLAQQGPRALLAIRVLVGVVPAVLWSGAIIFAALYPLGRQRHLEIRQELAKRRLAADGKRIAGS
jgi:GPH family glycoside/pentoside/hexuronide:cation symporter